MKFVSKQTVELVKTNACDIDVARAAWVSNYGTEAREKDTGAITGLINYLYSNRHMSPFEHGSFTFFIDSDIAVAREFMRHRTFSYNEKSGRYMELEPRFYVPTDERPLVQTGKVGHYLFVPGSEWQNRVKNYATKKAYGMAWRMYKMMLRVGVAKEVARNVLPVGIMTQYYATCNPRNLMQFLELRNDPTAMYEIREVAEQMEEVFATTMPITYEAYRKGRNG